MYTGIQFRYGYQMHKGLGFRHLHRPARLILSITGPASSVAAVKLSMATTSSFSIVGTTSVRAPLPHRPAATTPHEHGRKQRTHRNTDAHKHIQKHTCTHPQICQRAVQHKRCSVRGVRVRVRVRDIESNGRARAQTNAFLLITRGRAPNPAGNG